jgi:hypothetical protein
LHFLPTFYLFLGPSDVFTKGIIVKPGRLASKTQKRPGKENLAALRSQKSESGRKGMSGVRPAKVSLAHLRSIIFKRTLKQKRND